jgi:hypothetical protein
MAKAPTDLSQKWWHTNKAKTLKSTGLGAVLAVYETEWSKCEGPPDRCLEQFAKAEKALGKIEPAVKKAKSMCNKTLHKDTMTALDGYAPLIKRAGQELQRAQQVYQGYIDDWADIRFRTKAGMLKGQKEMEALLKKAEDTVTVCEKSAQAQKNEFMAKSAALAKKVLAELKAKQQSIDETLSEARVPKNASVSPHADDRPNKAAGIFEECRKIQEQIVGERKNAESRLLAAIKANGG